MTLFKLGSSTILMLLFVAIDARLGSRGIAPDATLPSNNGRRLGRKNCSKSNMLNSSLKYKICQSDDTSLCFKAQSNGDVELASYVSGASSFQFGFSNVTFEYADDTLDRVNIYSYQYPGVNLEAGDLADNDNVKKFKISVNNGNPCSLSTNVKISYYDSDAWVNENKYLRKSGNGFEWKKNSGKGTRWEIIEIS